MFICSRRTLDLHACSQPSDAITVLQSCKHLNAYTNQKQIKKGKQLLDRFWT
uniref:Uncharacterized protein n=1 Tax=Arundo donax TaxID=35708 RepID=A0A0A9U2I3_ARUDO